MNLCVTSFLWETKISVSCFTRGKSFAICEEAAYFNITTNDGLQHRQMF